ncbi:MAG TPA: mechanosensitive ion channel, partial [Phaeodactylibacter sp.]|nr:mechanosensitive ion channel [Phaeodactylibacter sp.]
MDWLNLDKLTEILTAYAPKVAGAILTLIIGFWVIKRLSKVTSNLLEKKKIDETVRPFLVSITDTGLKIMLLLAVASMFGINVTSFIAIFTALAFAIGMALQGSLGHFASGVLLLLFKPYRVGDLVTINDKTGVVEAVQIFNTLLRTPDNKRIIIPNGVVTSGTITNISGQGTIRVDMSFGIGYNDDIDKARSIIKEVADKSDLILKDPPIDIFVQELADSSVNFA